MDIEERLISLETKISYLESDLQELNQIIIAQDKTIGKLTVEAEEMKRIIKGAGEEEVPQDRPPHY